MSTTGKQQKSFLDALYDTGMDVQNVESEQSRGFNGSRYEVRCNRGTTVKFYEDTDGDIIVDGEDESIDNVLTNVDSEEYNIARSLN